MNRRWKRFWPCLGAVVVVWLAVPLQAQSQRPRSSAPSCSACHAAEAQQSSASLHRTFLERATPLTVHGNFSRSVELRGSNYLLEKEGESYFITEPYLSGKPWRHRVEYRLGGKRYEQYLTTLPDGSIVVLQPSWDVARKAWVHALDVHNPEASSRSEISVWNRSCYSCHVDGGQKNFDLRTIEYRTQWKALGVACEQCHGAGTDHAKAASSGAARAAVRAAVVNPARLDAARSTAICAQCHSFRDIYVEGFRPGASFDDFFMPVMEYRQPGSGDPAYWPDGRPRTISNESVALWQSQCYLKGGATCVTCHSASHRVDVARNPQLRAENNSLCAGCHKAIAENVAAHTHHAAKSAGSSCVECHMPRMVAGLNAEMRDHTIGIPVPENTARHGIPNACGLCHRDKDAAWAARQMDAWYSSKSRQKMIDRADAFAAAKRGDAAAVPLLQQIVADASAGPWIRANATGYLGSFSSDPAAYEAVQRALADPEPLVRGTAALAIQPLAAQRSVAAPAVAALLRDPAGTVRMNAAIGLAAMGVARGLPAEYQAPFDAAKELYRRRAALNSDDAGQQFAAGKFFLLAGDWDAAIESLRATLRLNPQIPARYDLASALLEKGDIEGARATLTAIPANDPQYSGAQKLLASLEARAHQPAAGAPASDAADALYRQGLAAYQSSNYAPALKNFDDALQAAPQASWATKAQIYRAVCLAKLSRTAEAERAMQALPATEEVARDLDLQLAWIELLDDTGRTEEALKHADALIAALPEASAAYLWRARILLQLRRTSEAAAAAERSVQLSPNLVPAHNLLLRIYQLQGRSEEAARQAEWLREFQRSSQPH